jgi:hypothetical protein
MKFELLDRYLLEGAPEKAKVVAALLNEHPGGAPARAFYDGMRILGGKTPDLTLIALRLVLAGKRAGDAEVVRLRGLSERARARGVDRQTAVESYYQALGE